MKRWELLLLVVVLMVLVLLQIYYAHGPITP